MRHNETVMLPINELMDFEAQPFKVLDDDSMYELAESIKNVGVLVPIIVRKQSGRYEIISGHRRKRACIIAGIETIPATVMELDDDEAAIMLVDSNLQRENLLPSEKAYAYKLKLDAIKHQGKKVDVTDDELLLVSSDLVGTESNKSGRQIRRYIRLTELIYPLLDKVDIKIIPVTAGAEVSFLNVKLQVSLNDQIDFYECKLNTHQATVLKNHYLEGTLTDAVIKKVLMEDDKNVAITLNYNKLKKYFPNSYTVKQCEKALWEILDRWHREKGA